MLKNVLCNTCPQIVHSPDDKSFLFQNIKKKFFKSGCNEYFDNKDLDVITWNNLSKGLCELSLEKNGVRHYVLGDKIKVWRNLMKFDLNVEFLRNSKADYCIGLDSHDVIFYGDPGVCLDRFLKMGCDLVFNGEIKFYPDYSHSYLQNCKEFERSSGVGKFCYLNSGAWIGRREFCLKFFEECIGFKLWNDYDYGKMPNVRDCDQPVVHGMYKKYYPRVKLDYNCEIFQNIAFVTGEVVVVNKWFL